MRRLAVLALATLLSVSGSAAAHAHLESAEPAPDSVLSEAPESVTLSFSMAIETRFSSLKVYQLEVPDGAMPSDLSSPSERERMRLEGLAGALVSNALSARDDENDPRRVDTGLLSEARTTDEVRLGLQEDLEPGVYVVMWNVLAIDTHRTQEHFLFFLTAAEED